VLMLNTSIAIGPRQAAVATPVFPAAAELPLLGTCAQSWASCARIVDPAFSGPAVTLGSSRFSVPGILRPLLPAQRPGALQYLPPPP
jgi:hypothetical protein